MVDVSKWILKETGFDPERNGDNGNRYLIGNGYMGVRGALEEFTKEQLAAINLSGLYDKVGDGWREPLNAPNALFACLEVGGERLHILERAPEEHELCLNYGEGILYRKTVWATGKGKVVLETERFAEMENPHYLHQRYAVRVNYDCDISVITGIDGDVWDIYGPHYQEMVLRQEGGALCAEAFIQERRAAVWVWEEVQTEVGADNGGSRAMTGTEVRTEAGVDNSGSRAMTGTEMRSEAEVDDSGSRTMTGTEMRTEAEVDDRSDRTVGAEPAVSEITEEIIRGNPVKERGENGGKGLDGAEETALANRKILRKLSCSLRAGQTFVLTKLVKVETDRDYAGQEDADHNYKECSYENHNYKDCNYKDRNYKERNYEDRDYKECNYKDHNYKDCNYEDQDYKECNYKDHNYKNGNYKDQDSGGTAYRKAAFDGAASYAAAKAKHIAHWRFHWAKAAVIIEGDDQAMRALNYSLYHLHSIAPRHSRSLSIPARGLSGQTYKGAVFWDTEMFMLPFFLYTDQAVARSLIRYRLDTLPGALRKAAEYGYEGAFYAWESQEGGFEACSDYNVIDVFTGRPMRTYFRDKQIHISAAIVYAIMRYSEISGDRSIWQEGGLETVLECARFYYGLLVKKVAGEAYELRDVIGPDEYHERVNNNGYTNRMAKYTFEAAARLLAQLAEIVPAEPPTDAGSLKTAEQATDAGSLKTAEQATDAGGLKTAEQATDAGSLKTAKQPESAGRPEQIKRQETTVQTERTESRKSTGQEAAGQEEEKIIPAHPPLTDWETACRIRNKYPVAKLQQQFTEAAARLYLPEPDENGILPQFDGYMALEEVSVKTVKSRLLDEKEYWGGAYGVASETKVIKQADVVTWLTLFAEEHSPEILSRNWHYYEPYTEHGSSLSACMYAWLACLCDMPDKAYPFFMKSALADWKGGGKQWAGLVYIGGSHPAAAGGAYMNAIHGFAGVSFKDGELKIAPRFPAHWQKMKFSLDYQGKTYDIEITKENGEYQIQKQLMIC